MTLNKILHMMITKYLWGKGWKSFYWQLAFRWSKDDKTIYRLKEAYNKQTTEDEDIERTTNRDQEVTNQC